MEVEIKYLIPLVGVLLGWLLSSLTSLIKEQGENKRRLGRAIVQLDNLNFEKIKLINHVEYLKDLAGIETDFEKLRKKAWEKYVFPEDNYKSVLEAVDSISGLYPLIGIKLKYLVESHLFSKKMKFDTMVSVDLKVYIKLLSAFEATFQLEQKELQRILFKLCFKHSLFTWFRMKRRYKKANKNLEKAKGSDFIQNLNADISGLSVMQTDETKNQETRKDKE